MTERQQGFSVGWMIISYFMVAGGFTVAAIAVALMKIQSASEILGWAFIFAGAALGGFFAGRASPGKTLLEPAVGGVLVFASLFALAALVPSFRDLMSGGSFIKVALISGAVVGSGGLIGAIVGEKTQSKPTTSTLRWAGISALLVLGAMFLIMMVAGILLAGQAAEGNEFSPGPDASGALGLGILALACIIGAVLTQAAAPQRMILGASLGIVVDLVILVPMAVIGGSMPGQALAGLIILAIGGMALGAGAAALTWQVVKGRKQADSHQVGQVFE